MRVKSKRVAKKSVLHDYVRMCYEEFAEVLCKEVRRKDPEAVIAVEKAVKKIIDEHFGKDVGGSTSVLIV